MRVRFLIPLFFCYSISLAQVNDTIRVMQFNLLNQMTQVFQGETDPDDGSCNGFARTFTYDAKFFLSAENNTETGTTAYGRTVTVLPLPIIRGPHPISHGSMTKMTISVK